MNYQVPNVEALFLAGAAGGLATYLVVYLIAEGSRRKNYESVWACVIYLVLAGYVAAFVVRPDSLAKAFSVGVALDGLIAGIRGAFLRRVKK